MVRILSFLILFGLLSSTSIGNEEILIANNRISNPESAYQEIPEATPEAEDNGGWLGGVIDAGSDAVTGVGDAIVDGASATWDVAEEVPGVVWDAVTAAPGAIWDVVEAAPGVVWDIINGTPGALAGAVSAGWSLATTRMNFDQWAEFLSQHWLLGAILGPIVSFLIGLAPDGSISILDIVVGLIVLAIPGVKALQTIFNRAENVVPVVDDAGRVVSAVWKNPNGITDGVSMMYRYTRAKVIKPTVDGFGALPSSPGVYVARNEAGQPLYVGMSSSLPRRVPQHFSSNPSPFAGSTTSLKIMPTKTPGEARALECALIKSLDPQYNTVHRNTRGCPDYANVMHLVP